MGLYTGNKLYTKGTRTVKSEGMYKTANTDLQSFYYFISALFSCFSFFPDGLCQFRSPIDTISHIVKIYTY
jgi:hypothetical protein